MKSMRFVLIASLICALIQCASPTSGALQAFLRVGDIEGDATAAGHEEWSEILSYDFSVQNVGWTPGGGDLLPSFSDMYITKSVDRASPYLLGANVLGQHFDTARIDVAITDGATFTNKIEWLFQDAVVSAYNTVYSGGGGSGDTLELVAIDFRTITYKYYRPGERVEPIGFTYDRLYDIFNWIGPAPTGFQLISHFEADPSPEPTAVTLATIGLALLAFWSSGRRARSGTARSPLLHAGE